MRRLPPWLLLIDPEKSLSGREHVILSVSGMTCTGCETAQKNPCHDWLIQELKDQLGTFPGRISTSISVLSYPSY